MTHKIEYAIRKGTEQAQMRGGFTDTHVDYLHEIVDGKEYNKVALNDGEYKHLSREEINKVFTSQTFQRALVDDNRITNSSGIGDCVGLFALTTLLPKEMQTAKLALNLIRNREQGHGKNDVVMHDLLGNVDAWSSFQAFKDIGNMSAMADKYGISMSNGQGEIAPSLSTSYRKMSDKATKKEIIMSAFKYLAEQERLVKENTNESEYD